MSEAMTSVEIEDVLSSIRRLVSADHRPAHRAASAAVLREPAQAGDKLILTPAFRVLAPTVAQTCAATTSRPESSPPALSGPEPSPAAVATAVLPLRPGPLPRLHLGVESVARVTAATLERAFGAQSIAWESELGDPPFALAQMDCSDAGGSASAARVVKFTQPVPQPSPLSRAQVEPGLPKADPAHSRLVAEPDRPGDEQAAAEAFAAFETSGSADVAHESSQADLSQAEPSDAGEMHLGEQVLRELVRELILAELNGTLGERMTRNVRKLVRAEIARAMSLRQAE